MFVVPGNCCMVPCAGCGARGDREACIPFGRGGRRPRFLRLHAAGLRRAPLAAVSGPGSAPRPGSTMLNVDEGRRAHFISSTILIAHGKAVPMVMVTPLGYGEIDRSGGRAQPDIISPAMRRSS